MTADIGRRTVPDAVPVPDTVAGLLDRRRYDDSAGLMLDDRVWTWRLVVAESDRYAAAIDRLVVGDIRHVGLLMENSPAYLFALFGAAQAGVTVVGLNNTRRGEDLGGDIVHTDCALVLTDAAHISLLEGLDLGGLRVIDVDSATWAGELAMADRLASPPTITAADTLLFIFTSGSTSAPKAVIMSNGRAAESAAAAFWFGSDDVLYCAMPLFHGNALASIVLPALSTGAAIALRSKFSASLFIDDLRRYNATFFTSVGRAIGYVLATPERPDDKTHSVKFALAPESSPADLREFRRRFGIMCVTGYGSSENAVVMVPAPGMPRDALGRPQEGTEAAVVDPETNELCPTAEFDEHGRMTNPDAAIGEIVGLNTLRRFEGYYRNPEATAERARNGWFWTGDLGYVDADGYFFFAGRKGDRLRVDSENFATAPVERVLGRFPGASGVAVYGVPDERTADDQVMAAIELTDGMTFDPESFGAFLSSQDDLAPKWSPRYLRITTLPVGATNKIDRRRLQRERWFTDDPIFWRPGRDTTYHPFGPGDLEALRQRFAEHGRSPDRA